jgi:hypothetical protein
MIILATWMYVLPDYIVLSKSAVDANNTIVKFNETTANGIPYPELSTILAATK